MPQDAATDELTAKRERPPSSSSSDVGSDGSSNAVVTSTSSSPLSNGCQPCGFRGCSSWGCLQPFSGFPPVGWAAGRPVWACSSHASLVAAELNAKNAKRAGKAKRGGLAAGFLLR